MYLPGIEDAKAAHPRQPDARRRRGTTATGRPARPATLKSTQL